MGWRGFSGRQIIALLLLGSAALPPAAARPLDELAGAVQEFTLPNGLRFLVVERHDAPIFASATVVDAGSADEMTGKTGIAHMFEHMAFKGTETVGTTDYAKERRALEAVDAAWDAVRAEQSRGREADSSRLAELWGSFRQAQEDAQRFVEPNEFSRLLDMNGGRETNAFTSTDMTAYIGGLPSNRIELWARLEADRLARPVLREFYMERDVVRNERRIQESSPMGRMFDNILTTAFAVHPYGAGVLGAGSDIEAFSRRDAQEFFDRHYVAENITIALVGDVRFEQVKALAEKYFSAVREGPKPPPVVTVEPVHTAERRVIAREESNPLVIVSWQAPASRDPDYAAMELLIEILASGRTSRLYQRLVKEEQAATQLMGGVGLPGDKYPNLAGVFAYVAADGDPTRAEALIHEEVERLVAGGPDARELEKVKTRYVAGQMRRLRQPVWLAVALAAANEVEGRWSRLFEHMEEIEAVTGADVQRVAREYLTANRRTVGLLQKTAAATGGGEER